MHLFIVPFVYLFCSFVVVKSSLEAKWKIITRNNVFTCLPGTRPSPGDLTPKVAPVCWIGTSHLWFQPSLFHIFMTASLKLSGKSLPVIKCDKTWPTSSVSMNYTRELTQNIVTAKFVSYIHHSASSKLSGKSFPVINYLRVDPLTF